MRGVRSGRCRRLATGCVLVLSLGLVGSTCERVKPPDPRTGPLRAGACAVEITPVPGVNHTEPIFLAGFGSNRRATGMHDPLWARGVVLEAGETKIALVTLDLVGYFHNEVETIRALVDPGLGIDSITVSSTHNHEGPDTMGLWGPNQLTSGVDPGYLDFVNDQVVACIEEADASLVPAAVKFATGSTEGASLPPWPDLVADGKVLQERVIDLSFQGGPVFLKEGDPGPILNTRVPVMQLRRFVPAHRRIRELVRWIFSFGFLPFPDLRPLRETIATVVNFASHPEALGSSNTLVTSDFPHFMREALEARYGGVAMYVSADLGVLQGPLDVDVADPDTGEPVPRRTFAFAARMGELLAERAADALGREHFWDAGPAIEVASDGPFFLEVENPFFQALGQLGVFGRRSIVEQDGLLGLQTEVQVLRIGDSSWVVTPNELDPQIGDVYREQIASARHRFIVGLGNDEVGYQMPEAKFNPTCFACFAFVLGGNEEDCPAFETLDCGTTMQNNVGGGADPVLQSRIGELIDELHP